MLMIDQKRNFTPKGITAKFVGEGQIDNEDIQSVVSGTVHLVYISPEFNV